MFAIQCLPVIRTIRYKTMDVISNADTEMTIRFSKFVEDHDSVKLRREKFETFRNKSELEEIGSQFYFDIETWWYYNLSWNVHITWCNSGILIPKSGSVCIPWLQREIQFGSLGLWVVESSCSMSSRYSNSCSKVLFDRSNDRVKSSLLIIEGRRCWNTSSLSPRQIFPNYTYQTLLMNIHR